MHIRPVNKMSVMSNSKTIRVGCIFSHTASFALFPRVEGHVTFGGKCAWLTRSLGVCMIYSQIALSQQGPLSLANGLRCLTDYCGFGEKRVRSKLRIS